MKPEHMLSNSKFLILFQTSPNFALKKVDSHWWHEVAEQLPDFDLSMVPFCDD